MKKKYFHNAGGGEFDPNSVDPAPRRYKKVGAILLITGCITLLLAIIMALTVGTYLVGTAMIISMLLNTAGILLLQYNKR